MKRSVLTYHPNCSTGLGGIETLNRSLKCVADSLDIEITELYNRSVAIEEQYFEPHPRAIYKQTPLFFSRDSILRELNKAMLVAIEFWKSKYDALVIFHPIYAVFIFPFVKKTRPVIVVQSNKISTLHSSSIMRYFGKRIVQRVEKFVCYTKYDEREHIKDYPHSKYKTCAIPRGCKLGLSADPAPFSQSIVTISRIHEHQKNFTEMIAIVSKMPHITLYIYGSGEFSEVEALKKKIDDIDNINYLGGTTEVAEVLRKHSVFIMTSDYEGYGQTLIEARSQGLPIVAYNTFEAAKTIVRNGRNGYLIAPGCREKFRIALEQISSSYSHHQQLSKMALSLSEENDNQVIEQKWADLLRQQLKMSQGKDIPKYEEL